MEAVTQRGAASKATVDEAPLTPPVYTFCAHLLVVELDAKQHVARDLEEVARLGREEEV